MEVDRHPAQALTAEQLLAQLGEKKNGTEDSSDLLLAQQLNAALITCDERCLTVYDANELPNFKDETLIGRTQYCLNSLLEKLAALPTEASDEGAVVKLPEPKTALPRFKRAPKRDEFLTKWDRFSRLKGIQKRKHSRREFDPETEHWKPRFGYDREAKDHEKESDWLIEVPSNADPLEDQFAKRASDKREQVAKNELQRLRNVSRRIKVGRVSDPNRPPADWPSENPKKPKLGVGVLPESIPHGRAATRTVSLARAHQDVKTAYENARVATASLGRFDPRSRRQTDLEKETKILKNRTVKEPTDKRVHFAQPGEKVPSQNDVRAEKESYLRTLDALATRRVAKQPINNAALEKAANRATAQAQSGRAVEKSKENGKMNGGNRRPRSNRGGKPDRSARGKFGGGGGGGGGGDGGKRSFEPKRFDKSNGKGKFSKGKSGSFGKGKQGGFGKSKGGFSKGKQGGFSKGKKGK